MIAASAFRCLDVSMTRLLSLFKIAALLVIAALTALILHVGDPNDPSWWIWAVPFWLWIVGPTGVAYLLARRRPTATNVWPLAAFLLLSSIASAFIYHDAFFRSQSSTAALALIFIPLYCWIGLGLTWLLAVSLRRFAK